MFFSFPRSCAPAAGGRFATALVLALAMSSTLPSSASAGDKVVVSTPALHSLTANLMAGVDAPALLFSDPSERTAPLTPEARAVIDEAKMMLWVGREYEPALGQHRAADPAVNWKSLTIASTTPLITRSLKGNPDRPGTSHDMRFWLDPRLAKIAAGRIASNLVRVYPDQADTILENEITLRKRLSALEREISTALESPEGVPLHMPESDVLYLAWRFNLMAPNCPAAAARSEGFGREAGPALYFAMMAALRDDLLACKRMAEKGS